MTAGLLCTSCGAEATCHMRRVLVEPGKRNSKLRIVAMEVSCRTCGTVAVKRPTCATCGSTGTHATWCPRVSS